MISLSDARPYERGVALVAVLWMVILLSVLASTLIAMSRSDTRRLAAERAGLQAREAADSGINLALLALSNPNGPGTMDGGSQSLRFGDAALEVSVAAEAGKIDLNTADPALIRGILMVAGVAPGSAESMTEAILSRRDAGNLNSGGVGSGDIAERPAAFQSLGELMQIQGMTPEIYDRLSPNVTLYSGASGVDPSVAPRDVLLAIPGNTAADAEAAIAARSSPESQGRPATGDLSRIIGKAFTITATARLPNGTVGRRSETVRLTGSAARPLAVLAVD